MLAGCTTESRIPTALGSDPGMTGGFISTGGTDASLLIGRWRNIQILQAGGNVLTLTTTWEFDADNSCGRARDTFDAVAGVTTTIAISCSFTVNGASINVLFNGAMAEVVLPFSFAPKASDVLMLGGVAYDRIG
jgi:hypothetical protein